MNFTIYFRMEFEIDHQPRTDIFLERRRKTKESNDQELP